MTQTAGPLQGIRVIDVSTIVAGPMAAQIMADQGAEVIKVESPPGGDGLRHLGPCRGGMGAAFHMYNRGKRSITLDLKTTGGAQVFRKLAGQADVLIQNFRPGVMKRLGLDYAALREASPQLVYVSISGFGENGPLAGKPAFDHILQCYAGIAALQASAATQGEPALVGNLVADKLTAMTAAQAATAALVARAQGDGGQEVTLSMLGAVIAFLWPDAAGPHHLPGDGAEWRPALSERARLYRFRDGTGTFNPNDPSYAALCRDLDAPTGLDSRLQTASGRSQHPELLAQVQAEWEASVAQRDIDETLALIDSHGAPCAKVRSLGELVGDEQVEANGYLRTIEHPQAGQVIEPRPAAEFSATPLEPTTPGPMLGQHTSEILGELGFDAQACERLQADGALG